MNRYKYEIYKNRCFQIKICDFNISSPINKYINNNNHYYVVVDDDGIVFK